MDIQKIRKKLMKAGFREEEPLCFTKMESMGEELTVSLRVEYDLNEDDSYMWSQEVTIMNDNTFESATVLDSCSSAQGVDSYGVIKDIFRDQVDRTMHIMKYGLAVDDEKKPLWLTTLEHFSNGFFAAF